MYAALATWPLTPLTLTREPATREGQPLHVHTDYAGRTLTLQARVGEPTLRVISAAGEVVATHRLAPAGAGQRIRSSEHRQLLEAAVLAAFSTDHGCRRKVNRPPGDTALAELARLKGITAQQAAETVVSFADYQQFADMAEVIAR